VIERQVNVMVRAGFLVRLGAGLVDGVFVCGLLFIGGALAMTGTMLAALPSRSGAAPYATLSGLAALLCLAYTLTEGFGARSLGKRMLKLRIAAAGDPYGAPPRWRLWLRWGIKYSPVLANFVTTGMLFSIIARGTFGQGGMPPALLLGNMVTGLLFLAVLGGFFLTLARGRQALHDLLAGTVVLRPGEKPQGFAPILAPPQGFAPILAPPPMNTAAPEAPETDGMTDIAGPGRRLKAAAIDVAAVVALLCVCMVLVAWTDRWLNQGEVVFIFVGGSVLLPTGYLLAEVWRGRTLGKWMTGLRVGHRRGGPACRRGLWGRLVLKSSPVFVGTAGMVAQIAFGRFPVYDVFRPYARSIENFARRLHSEAALGLMYTPLVYGAGLPLAALLAAGWLGVFSTSRRALHDRLTRTSVYIEPSAEPARAFEPLMPAT
jgi:uncharacterized RDD family membrane protein YckC